MTNKVLIIAGMHRSGTSLISQWLYKCGLNIGSDLVGAATGNAEGHFEDRDFVKLHESILQAHGLAVTGLIPGQVTNIGRDEVEKIRHVLSDKNEAALQWGWKDPRTCLFLSTYNQLLPQSFCLAIIRDYLPTVTSLINRVHEDMGRNHLRLDWFTRFLWKTVKKHTRKKKLYKMHSEFYLKVWISYNEQLLQHISKLPKTNYILIDYHALNKDDKGIFHHLQRGWGFNLEYVPFKSVYKKNLMSPAADLSPYIKDTALLNKAEKIYRALQAHLFIEEAVPAF